MPKLDFFPFNGRVPTKDKLRKVVHLLLKGNKASDHVIALTDVYTGENPPGFKNGEDARKKMRERVGEEARFHPHVAQYDFEAWLLPFWNSIQKIAGHNKSVPSGNPEMVNHNKPPSFHIKDIFRAGGSRKEYNKVRDAGRILRDNDLSIAINQCLELKAFINTIIRASGGVEIP